MIRRNAQSLQPTYRIPLFRLVQVVFYMARGRPRSLGADFRFLIGNLPIAPYIEGTENVPASGPVLVVANHYERKGLWMGWSGMLVSRAIFEHSGRRLRWIAIAEWTDYRIGPIRVPPRLTRNLFNRFYAVFGFIAMEPEAAGARRRAEGVRRAIQAAKQGDVIGIFPEGNIGSSPAMIPAQAGSGSFIRALHDRGTAILPVGISELGKRAQIQIGNPMAMNSLLGSPRDTRDRITADAVMRTVAQLVPPDVRGYYSDIAEALPPAHSPRDRQP